MNVYYVDCGEFHETDYDSDGYAVYQEVYQAIYLVAAETRGKAKAYAINDCGSDWTHKCSIHIKLKNVEAEPGLVDYGPLSIAAHFKSWFETGRECWYMDQSYDEIAAILNAGETGRAEFERGRQAEAATEREYAETEA